jgi:SAM-dependent methyltransferase
VEDRTRAHHRLDRLPPRRRFDEVECTVSHLLRLPHPALHGLRYGEALLQGIGKLGIRAEHVVEIGGGAGHVAEAAWRGDAGPFTQVRWTSLDLSPALLAAQRRRVLEPSQPRGPHTRWSGVRADALDLPFRAFSGLVLANEMIADLPRSTGPVKFVHELARVLTPGSAAVLTEFGGDFEPGPLDLGDHVEWSIDFRELRAAASARGFTVTELPLHELLNADLSVRCASYTDLWRLRRLTTCDVFAAPADHVRRRFPLLSRMLALELPPIGSPRWPDATAPGGFAQLFRALILRR